MKKRFAALVSPALLALLLTCTLAGAEEGTPAAPRLQKIKHTVLSSTSEQVALQLNGSYSPKVFTLKDENPRVIFDFDGMTYGKDIKAVTAANGSIVKRVRVGRHDDPAKTRIVFDVATFKGLHYTQEFDEASSSLVVRFTGPGKAALPPSKDSDAEPAPAKKTATAVDTPEKTPPAPSGRQEQAAAPASAPPPDRLPVPPPDKKEQAAAPPASAEPSHPAKQAAATPVKAVLPVAPKQPEPEKAVTPPPAQDQPKTKKTKSAAKPEATKEPAPPEKPAAQPEEPARQAAVKEAVAPPVPTPGDKKEEAAKAAVQETPPPPETAPQPAAAAKTEAEAKKAEAAAPAAPDADKAKETAKTAMLTQSTDKPQLEYVKFDDSSPKGEMVMFKLNGFHPPAIHGVEEGTPRVICDFNNTKLLQAVKGPIKANGKFVKVIRTTVTKKPDKIRVVIDLEPNRSYDLQQVFFKEDNLFVLFVNTVKK